MSEEVKHTVGLCDVCRKNEAAGVCSSALGPVSWAYCSQCLSRNAEPAVMFDATIDGCGGVDGVADWVRQMTTFVDGNYVPFDTYAAALSQGDTP